MSLVSWVRSVVHSSPPAASGKDPAQLVMDTLMSELEYQMKEKQKMDWEREMERRRLNSKVDYTWLISPPKKTFEIPQLERLEMEEMCRKVQPSECGTIVNMFHDALFREPTLSDMPKILRALIRQAIDRRPLEESVLKTWVSRRASSLTNMRPGRRVSPSGVDTDVNDGCFIEMQPVRGGSAPPRAARRQMSISIVMSESQDCNDLPPAV